MVKELKDIATDKPEDIAEELEERAKAREPAPVAEPDETVDEPENPQEAPAEGEATAEPEPSGQEQPEEPALLKRLRSEYKLDHTYKDEEALLKSHASLRRKLSERDPDAALGRSLREAGVSPEDLAELYSRKAEPARGKESKAPPKWDPAWDREIEKITNEDGRVEYRGPPDMVRQFREYEAELDSFRRDPTGTLLERWGLSERIEQIADQAYRRQVGTQQFEAYMKENGGFIDENRDEINALTRQGWPAMAAVEHMKVKNEVEGLRTGKSAEEAKKRDLDRLAGKATRRNGAATTPIRDVRDLAKLPFKDAIAARLAELGDSIPESW